MTRYGYARVSTKDQKLDRQIEALVNAGVAYERIFKDPEFWRTFTFSLQMAFFTIVVSILLVVPTAYWIRLRLPRLRPMAEFISMLPFVVPAIVLVFGLTVVKVQQGDMMEAFDHQPRASSEAHTVASSAGVFAA